MTERPQQPRPNDTHDRPEAPEPSYILLRCPSCDAVLNEPADRCPFCGAAVELGPVYTPPRGPIAKIVAWVLLVVFVASMLAVFWLALPW